MTTTTFDTLKFTEQLIEAGYTEQQAKGTVRAYQAAHADMEIATKSDIKELEYKIEFKMKELEHKLTVKICGIVFAMLVSGVSFLAWLIERHQP